MLTDQDIQTRLEQHARRIEKAKGWFMQPIPVADLYMRLKTEQTRQELEASYQRVREHAEALRINRRV